MSDYTPEDIVRYSSSEDGARAQEAIQGVLANKVMKALKVRKLKSLRPCLILLLELQNKKLLILVQELNQVWKLQRKMQLKHEKIQRIQGRAEIYY